ncbi:hypothetical protein [Ignicoccus islandicus]|uniref:hypothetical protein n=1 Tax=Ignicoccus islandicus TaxID=54259 RepID=UPI0012ED91F8|nr:hypothetical protein [Ignicoccus islandicus]
MARRYACKELDEVLEVIEAYAMEYGKYWFDALRDDLEKIVEREESIAEEKADVLFEAIRINARGLKGDLKGVAEVVTLSSLALLPEVKVLDWKDAVTISLELHVRRKYKEVLNKCIKNTYLFPFF